jgi:hypothetical protein
MSGFGIKITPDDRRFSLQIRSRDKWTCRKCRKVYTPPTNALQCAHHFTRRIKATRVDPDNALALCTGCHTHLDSNPYQKEAFWRAEIGDERFDALAARAHSRRDRV